ncbi:MAG: SBBP repeat-containing protein [Proteobacteria bacterium]|nr:SBBP repeat-containing protein [Pseudomonadota bacterium]
MKKICVISLLFLFFASTAFAAISKPNTIDPAKDKEIRSRLGILQIPFIKNESQIKDSKVRYYANTFAGTVFVTDDGITYSLRGKSMEHVGAPLAAPFVGAPINQCVRPEYRAENKDKEEVKGWVIKERLLNARKTKAVGIEKAETKVSYFKGKDQSNWKSNIPTYQEVGLGEVYDHINLSLKAYGKNIEKLFTIEKGGRPEDIRIKVEGAKGLKVNEKGELEIETGMGPLRMTRPLAYQEIDGKRIEVAAAYTIPHSQLSSPNPESLTPNPNLIYSFKVKDYNKNYPLIIDPLLASTFIGGSYGASIQAIAIDKSGNVLIAGETESSDFPTTSGAYDTSYNGGGEWGGDVFVSKLNSSLTTLMASTFLGGKDEDDAYGLAIDSSGNVFVAGYTSSSDFPTTSGVYDTSYNGGDEDVFVSKFNSSLTTLMASTFIGGSGYEGYGSVLAIDSSGNVFVAGESSSSNFPTTSGAYDTSYNGGDRDVFVSKFNSSLTTLMASTFIGGSGYDDYGKALAIDSSGNIFIAGGTSSPDFPTTPGVYSRSLKAVGGVDGFVSKFNNSLASLLASTFIGGAEGGDYIGNLAIDKSGNVFVFGTTFANDFPTTSMAYDTSHNGGARDDFVSKLNSNLTTLLASTYIGGNEDESEHAEAIVIDSSGNVFIASETGSSNFPTTAGAYDRSLDGYGDVFVSKFNNTLTSLLASTFLGGSDSEGVRPVLAIDSSGNIFIAGGTSSSDFPTTPGAYDTSWIDTSPYWDGFISKLDKNLSAGTGPSCTYTIDPTSKSFSYQGGTGIVSVTASESSCSWTATSNDDWITITSGSSETGSGTVNYSVSTNTGTSERTGTMTIAGQTFTVTQEGKTEPCAVSFVLSEEPQNINLIRKLRDEILLSIPEGAQYIQLFYENSPEIISIMKQNPAIREKAYNLFQTSFPYVLSRLLGNKVTIPSEVVNEIERLCDAMSREASPSLKEDIKKVKTDLKSGELFRKFGIKKGD